MGALLFAHSASSAIAEAQPSTVVVTVVDDLSRRPLANADVIDLASGRHRLTGEDGQVRLNWPPTGELRLRIREVGYLPVERTLVSGRDALDGSITVAMSRTAYVIAPVQSTSRCANEADEASRLLSVSALEQLRQGAEKYDLFRKSYPFEAVVEIRQSAESTPGQTVKRVLVAKRTFKSDRWEEKYRPGNIVIDVNSPRFQVPTLFLSTLADPKFWEHHCFVARSMEWLGDHRVVRLEFSPRSDIRGSDWEGAALLDSATSMLRRVEFRVANLLPGRGPQRIEGYTSYRTLSPFVVMPDTVAGIWWFRRPEKDQDWGDPDVGYMRYVMELKYRKERPPAVLDSAPGTPTITR